MISLISKKIKFREHIREKLTELDPQAFENNSLEISKNLFRFLNQQTVIQENVFIGAFAPIEKEPLWYKSFDTEKVNLAFPCVDKDHSDEMIFKVSKFSELELQRDFGSKILGPKKSNLVVTPQVVLIPALAFSKKGERLGRGRGFFDRYLESFTGLKVGIGFEMQVFLEIPVEAHDIKCDFLITEKEVYKF